MYALRTLTLAFVTLLALGGLAHADGNVTAQNKGGSLVVIGDGSANGVFIEPGPGANQLVVGGFNGTTVNGSLLPQVISGIAKNVNVNLEDGDDDLVIQDVQVPGRLLVKLDTGDDTFDYTDGSVAGNASVKAGKGVDQVIFSTMSVGGNLKIKGEGEPDDIGLDLVSVTKNTTITGGDGDDTVFVAGGSAFTGRFKVASDRGFDQVDLEDSTFTNKVSVALGAENDEVSLGGITAQNLVTLDGGSGIDTYTDDGGNTFNGPPLVLKKIEIVN
jgi:hypothetical protein